MWGCLLHDERHKRHEGANRDAGEGLGAMEFPGLAVSYTTISTTLEAELHIPLTV